MRVTLVAVGRLKEPHFAAAAAEYLKRLKPHATLTVAEVPDRDVTRDERRAMAEEGDGIIRALPGDAHCVALDLRGRKMTSEEFAAWIEGHALAGRSSIAFVIGGAAGLDDEVLARCEETISLSSMTLPHQLARVFLLEQLYRAFKINRGEPYHR